MKYGPMRLGYRICKEIPHYILKLVAGLKIIGLENVPITGSLWIVSNHQSNFDPPIIGSTMPREIYFAAKRTLFKGFLGKIITYLNSIPVNRSGFDKDVVRRLTDEVKNGKACLIFPEGTRSLNGRFLAIKGGVGMLLTMAPAPIIPVRIEGSWRLDRKQLRREPLRMYIGKPISQDEFLSIGADLESRERYIAISNAIFDRIRTMGSGDPERAAID